MKNISKTTNPPKVANRLRDWMSYRTTSHPFQVDTIRHWLKIDALDFDAPYQRGYVWTEKEQNEFLKTLLRGFPIGVIAYSEDHQNHEKETKWVEVVDGKQRLTTLGLVFENKIPLPLPDGSTAFWDDLTLPEQRHFRSIPIHAVCLPNTNYKDRLDFFYRLNFAGVPQSEEHMKNVMEMIKHENEK